MAMHIGPFKQMIRYEMGGAFMIVRMAYDGTLRDSLGMYPPVLWGTPGTGSGPGDETSDEVNNPERPTDLTPAEALKDTKDVHEHAPFNFFRNYVNKSQIGEYVFWFIKIPKKSEGDFFLTADSSAWDKTLAVKIKIWSAGSIAEAIKDSATPLTLETVGEFQDYMTSKPAGKMDYAASFPGFVTGMGDHRLGEISIKYPPPDELRTLGVKDQNGDPWPTP